MLNRLDHVSILVADVDRAVATYSALLGIEPASVTVLKGIRDQDDVIDAAYIELQNCKIEIIAPVREDGPTARALAKRGEGLHHVDFASDDLAKDWSRVQGTGLRLVDNDLRVDEFGTRYAYVHPKDVSGVLICLSDPTNVDDYRERASTVGVSESK